MAQPKEMFDYIADGNDDYTTAIYRGKRIAVVDWEWFKSVAPEFKEAQAASTNKQSTPCTCTNSCVDTIYICKDCGGRVNSK